MSTKIASKRIWNALNQRFDREFADEIVGELYADRKMSVAAADRLDKLLAIEDPVPYDMTKIREFMLDYTPKLQNLSYPAAPVDRKVINLANKINYSLEGDVTANKLKAVENGFAEYGYDMVAVNAFQAAQQDVIGAMTYLGANEAVSHFSQDKNISSHLNGFQIGDINHQQMHYRDTGHFSVHATSATDHIRSIRDHFRNQMLGLTNKSK